MNQFKVYHDSFKTLEQYIREYLNYVVNKDPTSKSINTLRRLRKNYDHLLKVLDSIVFNCQLNTIEQFRVYQEAIECLKKINDTMNEIPPLEDIILRNIDRKAEHVKCSFLGLEDEVAEYLLGMNTN